MIPFKKTVRYRGRNINNHNIIQFEAHRIAATGISVYKVRAQSTEYRTQIMIDSRPSFWYIESRLFNKLGQWEAYDPTDGTTHLHPSIRGRNILGEGN